MQTPPEPAATAAGKVTRSRSAFGTEEPVSPYDQRDDRCATGTGDIIPLDVGKPVRRKAPRITRAEEVHRFE